MGMGVALVLDQNQLADPRIGLAQAQAELLRQSHLPLACPVKHFGVGRKHHRFGCTVVSITTRARSDGFIASVRVGTARLSCNSVLSLSSPIRWRHRVSDDRSNTKAC